MLITDMWHLKTVVFWHWCLIRAVLMWYFLVVPSVNNDNEGISSASFCRKVAALVPYMFCNFYLVKNHKIANNSASTETREKITTYLWSLEFMNFFDICLTKFKNYQIILNIISHRFLVTIKLFSGWKSLIKKCAVPLPSLGSLDKTNSIGLF